MGRTEVRSIPGVRPLALRLRPVRLRRLRLSSILQPLGYYRSSPFYYGWNDPFLFGGFDDVRSYTVYTSYVDVDIRDRSGRAVFEGSAKAVRGPTSCLGWSRTSSRRFHGFPGRSGETVRITVTRRNAAARQSAT
jgi:hypothetical protein